MPPRAYRSELRADQAASTRDRILDAAGALVRRGDRELAYATLAAEARVSIPTVYRHFPTAHDLYAAMLQRVERDHAAPATLADLHRDLATFFARFDDPDDPMGGLPRLNTLWAFSRAVTVPRRRALMEALVDAEAPGLPEPTRGMVVDLGVVLVSSALAEAMRGYLDLDGPATAARVSFALDALLAHARTLHPAEAR